MRLRSLCSITVALGMLAIPAARAADPMTFRRSSVPVPSYDYDLYEPSVAVSATGAVYVAAHAFAAFTTRAPALVSRDDGATWDVLPGVVKTPPQIHGSGMVDGDEGIVTTDATGRAWMLDNGLMTMPLYGWCDDGRTQCHHNPNAWDITATVQCGGEIVDRPWAAYGHDHLLVVNNGSGVAEVGSYDVSDQEPFTTRFGHWNACANPFARAIPGPPAVRDADGAFVVPQVYGSTLHLLHGTVDDVTQIDDLSLFRAEPLACGAWDLGFAGYAGTGTLYAAAAWDLRTIRIGASTDGTSFPTADIHASANIHYLWVSGNPGGEGALVTWVETPADCSTGRFMAAHVTLDENGAPVVRDVSEVVAGIPYPSGDYMGSAVGPDGRAYVAVYGGELGGAAIAGSYPVSVYIQDSGTPTF